MKRQRAVGGSEADGETKGGRGAGTSRHRSVSLEALHLVCQ